MIKDGKFWDSARGWLCLACEGHGHADVDCPEDPGPPMWQASPLEVSRRWDSEPTYAELTARWARLAREKKERAARQCKIDRYSGKAGQMPLPRDRVLACLVSAMWDRESGGKI